MRFRSALQGLLESDGDQFGVWPALYCLWAALAICSAIAFSGFSAESITRLLVIAFLFCQIALRSMLVKALPQLTSKVRFIVLGTILAAVVEGFVAAQPDHYREACHQDHRQFDSVLLNRTRVRIRSAAFRRFVDCANSLLHRTGVLSGVAGPTLPSLDCR